MDMCGNDMKGWKGKERTDRTGKDYQGRGTGRLQGDWGGGGVERGRV
jgi:hypothetical protein